jgi:hypothetical protein
MNAQYVDPEVSRNKFDEELRDFRALESEYRQRGWFLTEAGFPRIQVLMAAPQLKPPAIVTGVAFDYTNYDAEPPSVKLVNPFTGQPYLAKELPTRLDRDVSASQPFPPQFVQIGMPMVRISQIQPFMQWQSPEDVPFLCVAGVREYHEHPAHSGDSWELHRAAGAGRLVRLLEIVSRYGVESIKDYTVQLLPQVSGFQVDARA